jgi:hypothetical protein
MWVLRGYVKGGDRLLEEHTLSNVEVGLLREIWNRPADDPMFDAYAVTPPIARRLEDLLPARFDFGHLEYFLEFDRDVPL